MKNLKIKSSIFLIIVIFLTGCGTIANELSDNDHDDVVPQTESVATSDVSLNDNSYPNDDYVESQEAYVVPAGAEIAVYNHEKLRGIDKIASKLAAGNGTFKINLGAANGRIYIVITELGKEPSEPLFLERSL